MIVRTGKVTHGKAVGLGHLAKKINSRHAARSGHVLHDNRGIAGDMLGEMTRDDSPFDIRGAAGGKVDEEVYSFSLGKTAFPPLAMDEREKTN